MSVKESYKLHSLGYAKLDSNTTLNGITYPRKKRLIIFGQFYFILANQNATDQCYPHKMTKPFLVAA